MDTVGTAARSAPGTPWARSPQRVAPAGLRSTGPREEEATLLLQPAGPPGPEVAGQQRGGLRSSAAAASSRPSRPGWAAASPCISAGGPLFLAPSWGPVLLIASAVLLN